MYLCWLDGQYTDVLTGVQAISGQIICVLYVNLCMLVMHLHAGFFHCVIL